MVCKFRRQTTLKPDNSWEITKKVLKGVQLQEYLRDCILFWKWLVEKGEVDIQKESVWRTENKRNIEKIIEKISIEKDGEKVRNLLLKLFSTKKEDNLLWSSWGGFVSFIESISDEKMLRLQKIILEIRSTDSFEDRWVDEITQEMIKSNQKFKKLNNLKGTVKNLLGELFGKLHIDKHPIYNGNAKSFLDVFFNYRRDNYVEFENCFNEVKKTYRSKIGRLSSEMPENMEIDMMFNTYYHGKKDFGEKKWKKLREMWSKNKNSDDHANNFKDIESALASKPQIILYGPPGTGKTYKAREYAKKQGATLESGRLRFVTFHPSFSYEDFVEGIRPEINNAESSNLRFTLEEGIFKRMAREAYNALAKEMNLPEWQEGEGIPSSLQNMSTKEREALRNKVKELINNNNNTRYYLIIDEINRGDISKIFGELITLLEEDKRLFEKNEIIVTLPYSKKRFGVPPNLYIIGTMNTADRSIALIDVALRRRFAFVEMMPSYRVLLKELLNEEKSENEAINEIVGWGITRIDKEPIKLGIKALYELNKRIRENYDRDHQIGHSYYLQLKGLSRSDLEGKLQYIWLYEIIPLIQEYFYGNDTEVKNVLFECKKNTEDIFECYRDMIRGNPVGFLKAVITKKNSENVRK